jgi:hypothetical protein
VQQKDLPTVESITDKLFYVIGPKNCSHLEDIWPEHRQDFLSPEEELDAEV